MTRGFFIDFIRHLTSDALNFVVNTNVLLLCLLRNLMHQTLHGFFQPHAMQFQSFENKICIPESLLQMY